MLAIKSFFKKYGLYVAMFVVALTVMVFLPGLSASAEKLNSDIAITDATAVLTAVGVLGVIIIAATIGLAALLWRKFRH